LSEPVVAKVGGPAGAGVGEAGGAGPSGPPGAGVPEPPNRNGAFPRLDEEQRARLRMVGDVRKVSAGDVLFREGDETYDFFLVESGAVTIVQGYGCEDRVIAVHGPHRFLGELSLLTGSTAYLTAVVRDPGDVVQVPLGRLHVPAQGQRAREHHPARVSRAARDPDRDPCGGESSGLALRQRLEAAA